MKRIRYEQIHSSVHQYLKRRQYSDHEVIEKKEHRWVHDVKDMALKSSASGETTTENILLYSSISGDTTVCEQQFSRLKTYLGEAIEPYKDELAYILYPLFVHIYLHLIYNGHKAPAHKFYSRHVKLFESAEELVVMEALHKLYTRTEVISCKEAMEFREHKFKVRLSQEALDYLMKYLKVDDNMMLLQIFNQHLKVEVLKEDKRTLDLKGSSNDKHESVGNERKRPTDIVRLLQQCIKQVREGPPCMSSICFYTFLNAYQGLCTVDISPDRTLLSAGFEDSSVKLWSITPGLIQSYKTPTDPSKLYLSADFWTSESSCEEEAEDEAEEADGEDSSEETKPQYREVAALRAHNGSVYKTCFCADSKGLLSCSEDGSVRLWDLKTHTNKVCYRGHNYPVWDIDTSSIGNYFASASKDNTAKLWVTDRSYPLRSFIGHSYDVDCVKFHPNCNYLATGSSDRTVRLWSLQDGKSVRLMQGHRSSVLALAFSPNGQYLASAGDDRRIRVWDLTSGNMYKELKGHIDTIHCLSFNRDSTLLASGGLDCCIKIWDIRKGVSLSNNNSSNNNNNPPDGNISPEQLGSFPTKSAIVTYLQFAQHNLLYAAGSI
ncbi:TAF5-like RNA polymerase II p300/CBP-associated factor-associated factor 65 kDa subunit 5L [Pecten maximus]|uniref:TAF5-like RNA polymerase II p300/CBP-associated factor-associated factor 65 kDa subunit 5L n=1 Tax=Pecten maximus TaxID=6579 RepID=UPI0014584A4C|nr:TAF5-like RNA polymerase II p300/CBP-associated factor-associated factor 65 kDa subunit 5L [Pecten maximus]